MNTAERVVAILNELASAGGPCGVSELSHQLKIGKNNIFRILSALEDKGWIEQNTETKKYSLTGAMAGVAFRALSQLDIQKISLPYLHELQQTTGETSALGIRVELERMFISRVPSSYEVQGHLNLATVEQVQKNAAEIMLDQVIKGLTVLPPEEKSADEPGLGDIVFQGTFEEVNEFFYNREWSEGLPIVPPAVEKVEQFLKFTERYAGDVIGKPLPDNREATIWNIAVNGVMAGCRPEYMPVLVAVVEAMADPTFGQEHLGHTPGTEPLIIIND